jgi:hypothetical protein
MGRDSLPTLKFGQGYCHGNKLVHAISRNKAQNFLIEGNDGVINDHISIFWNNYWLKGTSEHVYCYYETKKGKRPEGVDASSKWHTNISLAKDLLRGMLH